ncbi:hypothetical protein GQ53DRAFT_37880 [Thozetella sp. PMI_491]|nr:hypothetical protein GQ53DRAFT_37880 [Thozetella sp. PMI_491]
MDDYQSYLAENILTEDKVITYRLLSRELKVHVNTAKQMLFDFHKSQNEKKPGSVYATYLVYGSNKSSSQARPRVGEDGDVEMTSSCPDADSIAETVPTYTMSLVQEDNLKDTLADYEEVASIHVYSVGPHPAKDLVLLSEVARQVLVLQATDDSPATRKLYGAIPNAHVRRRERKGFSGKAVPVPVKQEPKLVEKHAAKPAAAAEAVKEEAKSAAPTKEVASSSAPVPTKKPIPTLKKANSGIMQAFSKAAAKPSKPKAPKPVDTPMSDDGEDDEEMPRPQVRQGASERKSRKEREDELRRMMDDDDDDEDEEDPEEKEEEDPMEEPVEEPPATEPAKEEPKEIVASSGDGRRRGKRRVMKKKQVMDDQGYLVTVQEAGWESFSEDETPPASAPKPASAPAQVQAEKAKKSAPKKGQGSIMSFFAKK